MIYTAVETKVDYCRYQVNGNCVVRYNVILFSLIIIFPGNTYYSVQTILDNTLNGLFA